MSTEERLARLERSQRWLRYANVVLVGTVLALAVPCCTARNDKAVSSPPVFTVTSDGAVFIPGVLRARGVEVLNLKGQLAVRLTEAGISTRNAEGKELVSIGATEDSGGGAIWTCSTRGKWRPASARPRAAEAQSTCTTRLVRKSLVCSATRQTADCSGFVTRTAWRRTLCLEVHDGRRPGDQWQGPRPRATYRQKAPRSGATIFQRRQLTRKAREPIMRASKVSRPTWGRRYG